MIARARIRKTICALAALLMLAAAALFECTAHADVLSGCGEMIDVFSYGDQLYILCGGDTYNVIVSDAALLVTSYEIDISPDSTSYAFYRGNFYFLISEYSVDTESANARIKRIDCSNGAQTAFIINDVAPRLDVPFGYDGEHYYFPLSSTIGVYDNSRRSVDEIPLTGSVLGMFPSEDGKTIFCACSDGIITIGGGSDLKYPVISSRVCQFGGYFSDENSVIYALGSGEVIFDGFDPTNGNAIVGDWLIGRVGDDLTAVRGEQRAVIGSAFDTSAVRAIGDTVFCLTQNGGGISVERITADDIEAYYEEQNRSSDIMQTDTGVLDSSADVNVSETVSPYVYDDENMTVSGIDIGTTAAVFRRECGDSGALFYRADGSEKKSGVLGTGMTVEFSDGAVYTLVIYGDVTGEGSVNSRDYRLICSYLFGEAELEGVYREAGDVVCSGSVDLADLTALDRYIHGKYEIMQR